MDMMKLKVYSRLLSLKITCGRVIVRWVCFFLFSSFLSGEVGHGMKLGESAE